MRYTTIYKSLRWAVITPALSFSLLLLSTSCEDQVMELDPMDRISEEAAFATAERAELAMIGVYDAAQSGFYAGGATVSRGYPFGAASIEQGDTRGEDVVNLQAFYQITYENSYNASTANNQYMWENLYAVINKANVVIEGVQTAATNNIITPEKALEYEGEARFLRALSHHELLVHFARPYNHTPDASHLGVPYRTMAVNTPAKVDEAKTQGRNTVKECYDLLLEDLNFAETNLPATRTANMITRATQGAAIAIKTRVLLHKQDFSGVISEGDKLVPTAGALVSPVGGYKLTATPEGPFTATGNKSNTESIFSIENSATDNPGTNGALPQMYGAGGRFLIAISPIIYNATFWPADDLRRTQLTMQSASTGLQHTTKYKDVSTWSDNAPVIRYAEVLLNLSEALARTTPLSTRAVELLNAVRSRATASYALTDMASNDDLIQAIVNERRIEFLAEGLRWKDIHRLAVEGKYVYKGIPNKVAPTGLATADYSAASGTVRQALLASIPAVPYEDFRFIWPIPLTEVNANPVLAEQQNPNY